MNRHPFHTFFMILFFILPLAAVTQSASAQEFRQPEAEAFPQLFQWTDTCKYTSFAMATLHC